MFQYNYIKVVVCKSQCTWHTTYYFSPPIFDATPHMGKGKREYYAQSHTSPTYIIKVKVPLQTQFACLSKQRALEQYFKPSQDGKAKHG